MMGNLDRTSAWYILTIPVLTCGPARVQCVSGGLLTGNSGQRQGLCCCLLPPEGACCTNMPHFVAWAGACPVVRVPHTPVRCMPAAPLQHSGACALVLLGETAGSFVPHTPLRCTPAAPL